MRLDEPRTAGCGEFGRCPGRHPFVNFVNWDGQSSTDLDASQYSIRAGVVDAVSPNGGVTLPDQ